MAFQVVFLLKRWSFIAFGIANFGTLEIRALYVTARTAPYNLL